MWRGPPDPDTGLLVSGVTVSRPKLVFPPVGLLLAGVVPPPAPDAAQLALIEQIEELDAELGAVPFLYLPYLRDRKIHVVIGLAT